MIFTISPALATIIAGILYLIGQVWSAYMLSKIHTLVNSNFSEAKAARLVAENALKAAQEINLHLQRELDGKAGPTPGA
jgi:hypothetical protein